MRTSAIAAVLLVATAAAAADLTIRQKTTTTGSRGTSAREDMVYVTASAMVVDGEQDRTIVDVASRTITLADKTEKTWFTVTTDQLRAQADAVQAELKRHLSDMPPEARAMAEKMMGGAAAEATVTPTGKHETNAGYDAAEYRVRAGALTGSVWASTQLPTPDGLAQWKEMSLGTSGPQGPGRGMAEAFAKIQGFPLRTTMTGGGPGAIASTTEVLEVREASPPAAVLSVPEGFRKVDPPTMGSSPPRKRTK